jgi:hypothetical protein
LLDGWMAGWLDGWMAGWLDGWMARGDYAEQQKNFGRSVYSAV